MRTVTDEIWAASRRKFLSEAVESRDPDRIVQELRNCEPRVYEGTNFFARLMECAVQQLGACVSFDSHGRAHLRLVEENLDISVTGFVTAEIDSLLVDHEAVSSDPADDVDPSLLAQNVVSKTGDLWVLGRHRLLCGDARSAEDLDLLMDGKRAAMAFGVG